MSPGGSVVGTHGDNYFRAFCCCCLFLFFPPQRIVPFKKSPHVSFVFLSLRFSPICLQVLCVRCCTWGVSLNRSNEGLASFTGRELLIIRVVPGTLIRQSVHRSRGFFFPTTSRQTRSRLGRKNSTIDDTMRPDEIRL